MDIFYKKDKDAFGNIINKYNIESLDNQTGAEFEYRAQHCAGKIRCWEKMFIEKPIYGYDDKYKTIIEKIKKNYLYRSKHGEFVTDMYEVWDWNLLIKKCDKVMKDFDGNIDADVPKDYSVNIK